MPISQKVKGVIMWNLGYIIFYMKKKILINFYICISEPLTSGYITNKCDLSYPSFKQYDKHLPQLLYLAVILIAYINCKKWDSQKTFVILFEANVWKLVITF